MLPPSLAPRPLLLAAGLMLLAALPASAQSDVVVLGNFEIAFLGTERLDDGDTVFIYRIKEIDESNAPQDEDTDLIGWSLGMCRNLTVVEITPTVDEDGIEQDGRSDNPALVDQVWGWRLALDFDGDGEPDLDEREFRYTMDGRPNVGTVDVFASSQRERYRGQITGPTPTPAQGPCNVAPR